VAGIVENGLIEARDFDFAYRAGENDTGRVAELIAQIVAQQPAVIVSTTTGLAVALHKATNTIPIVNTTIGDPVGLGLATSIAHPGGNFTGMLAVSGHVAKQLDASKNRWHFGVMADSLSLGTRGISDGGATGIF